MKSEFEIAITQLSADRNLSPEIILEAIEAALVSAYKRNYGSSENVTVTVDPHTGQARVCVHKQVVDTVEDEQEEIALAEAREYDPEATLGSTVEIELRPRNFGRIAAQTAKQVIMQRIREAERDSVYVEYVDRVSEIVNGAVRNVDARSQNVTLGLGKAEGLLPRGEQIPGEYYRVNQRLTVYILTVDRSGHGPQIIVSRRDKGLLRRLLEREVPEIYNGAVEIKSIAREAGSRSKVAVAALQAGVDPVGSCVGMRGVRIQSIVNELNGEKIDVVEWSKDERTFIANALSPAKVTNVILNPTTESATVIVPDQALSLAIGKEGQNARLAAKLTNWRIDIRSETEAAEDAQRLADEAREAAAREAELKAAREAAAALLAQAEVGLDALDTEEEEAEPVAVEADTEAEPEEAHPETSVVEEPAEEAEAEEPVEQEVEPAPEAQSAEVESAELEGGQPGAEQEIDELEAEQEGAVTEDEEPEFVSEEEYNEDESVEWADDDEDADKEGRQKSRSKRRKRRLVYDERLGEVVARKRHKRNRDWEDWEDEGI
jgi:transcription termination/antitermination protein NusA